MDAETFAHFLGNFDPDPEEAGRQYNRLHEKLAGQARAWGLADSEEIADEVLDRAATRIATGAIVPRENIAGYCRGILSKVGYERLRREKRATNAFHTFLDSLSDNLNESLPRIYFVLKPCFEKLSAADQHLLIVYCQLKTGRERAQKREELAVSLQLTGRALRICVCRLRKKLADCVKKRSIE